MSPSPGDLVTQYGAPRAVDCDLGSIDFPPLRERAHGEVCMAIQRKNGRFLLQTKESYPGSVMRLPSGGISAGEDVEAALLREIWEETNLTVRVEAYVACIGYRAGEDRSAFKTHLFRVTELSGELMSNDPSERISGWEEASPEELRTHAGYLRRMRSDWRDWGDFRAFALDVLADEQGQPGASRETGAPNSGAPDSGANDSGANDPGTNDGSGPAA